MIRFYQFLMLQVISLIFKKYYPTATLERYNISSEDNEVIDIILKIAHKQNYILNNKEEDLERTSLFILQEYRMGYFGRITLDRCVDDE